MLIVTTVPLLHGDHGPMRLGEAVQRSELIILGKLVPNGEKLDVTVEEVLKGTLPQNFALQCWSSSYKTKEGRETRNYVFDMETFLALEDLVSSPRRLIFLHTDWMKRIMPFHPACFQTLEVKPRVIELLAMMRNPAPFVSSQKYRDDIDLINLLGYLFYAARVSAPGLPDLERSFSGNYEQIPWEHICFTLKFTFVPTRKPMLQMEPFDVKGPIAHLIRQAHDSGYLEKEASQAKNKLPAAFSVTVDTTWKTRVGDLSSEAAAEFLRARLRSEDLEVVQASFHALGLMLDRDAVPIAIDMLRLLHKDRKFRAAAARFLSWAKDPRSVAAICMTLDELPRYIPYGGNPDYDPVLNELGSGLGEAVCNLRDAKTIPALKRAILKGYAGFRISWTLSQIGSEDAFEVLITNVRSLPAGDSFFSALELVNMVRRSNLPIEPWMKRQSSDSASNPGFVAQWVEWWEQHKAEFRIVRSSEEAWKLYGD